MRHAGTIGSALDDVTVILVAGALGVGGYFLYKLFGGGSPPGASNTTSTQQTSADLQTSINSGQPLSYPLSQYQSWAQQIWQAMSSIPSMTNSAQIIQIFTQMNNLSDLLELITAFGTQSSLLGSYTLPTAVQGLMEQSDIDQINADLQNAGINYQF
jgi:hypothetical protein